MKNTRKILGEMLEKLEALPTYAEDDFDHVVSYSELSSFRQCPLKHELEYKQRWSKSPRPGGPLTRGTAWHAVLETFYNTLQEGQEDATTPLGRCVQQAKAAAREHLDALLRNFEDEGLSEEDIPLLRWMLDGYLEFFAKSDAANWIVLETENRVIVPLDGGPGKQFGIKLKMDLLVWDLREEAFLIVDHKSGRSLPDDQDLSIDDQFGLYQAGYKLLGLDVAGTIHNAAISSMTLADRSGEANGRSKPKSLEQRFRRTLMTRTDVELDSIRLDALAAARVAYNPDLPLYSSPDPRQCGWKCSFKEAHLSMREGRNLKGAMLDYGFQQRPERH